VDQALLSAYRYAVLLLLTLGLLNPIAQAQVDDAPLFTSVHIVITEDNASQGFTPNVTDISGNPVREQHTFAIVTSPARGVAAVVTAAQAGQVSLAWEQVEARNLDGYRIYYRLSAYPVDQHSSCLDELGDAETLDVSATETTVTVPDLEPGMTYCFGVKAYDDAEQESAFSNTLRYQLPHVGQLVYTPASGFKGTDSFFYRATDSRGASVVGLAHVTVMPVNDADVYRPPVSAAIAAYSFDEGTGSAAFDASDHLNDGIISGASWTTQGRFGHALSFDGNGDWVTVADDPSLDLSSGMTLEAWVYPTAAPGGGAWQPLLLKEGDGIEAYYLYLQSDGASNQPLAGMYIDDWQDVGGETNLPLNTWTHLAMTYDGSTLRFYINGEEVGSEAQSGPIQSSSGPLRIGGTIWGAYFQGRIDEVRIYDRALNVGEIWVDMNLPVASPDRVTR